MRSPLYYRKLTLFLAVVLSLFIPAQSFAQQQLEKVQPAGKGFEVSGYLVQSDRELECNPEGARIWAKKALDTATSARETDPAMIDTLGDLKSQSNIKIVEAAKRFELLNKEAERVRGLIKQAKLEGAQARLQQLDPKGCYSGFEAVRSEIGERKSKAEVLVRRGDAVLDTKPKEAIEFYANARQVDAEYSGLDQRTNFAKKPASSKSGARTARETMATPRAVEPLIAALKDTDARVRFGATLALGDSKDPRAVEALVAALNDADARVRFSATDALGGINEPRAAEALVAALKSTDAAVRYRAAEALGEIKDSGAEEALVAALKDENLGVRQAAADALGQINMVIAKSKVSPSPAFKWQDQEKPDGGLAAAEREYKRVLTIDPTQASASYSLGITILREMAQIPDVTRATRYSEAFYYLARSLALNGPNALPAASKKSAETALQQNYLAYHGDEGGIEELKRLAASGPAFPAADFQVKSIGK